jgi:ParB-like chromosome segregation protein Spo0J
MANNLDPNSEKITGLAASIKENGVRERLQVEETRQGRMLADGHHRLLAAKQAGLSHLPVRVYANTPEGRRAANRAMLGK